MDGYLEVHERTLARRVERRFFPMTPGGQDFHVYSYGLVEPVDGGRVEYVLIDIHPATPR